MIKFRQALSLFFASLLLFGCSSIPETVTSVEWQSHQSKLKQITSYNITGKLAYISPQQRQSLNFQWKHSEKLSHLRLTTFLGQTALNLTITPQGAKVVTYDDETFTEESATQLVYNLTGLMIPIDHMPQWLLGLPTGADQFQLNETNTLASLNKKVGLRQWQLEYQAYKETTNLAENSDVNPLPLPSKLKFTQADTTINIVVSKWKITE